jgi:hypothetical protein
MNAAGLKTTLDPKRSSSRDRVGAEAALAELT